MMELKKKLNLMMIRLENTDYSEPEIITKFIEELKSIVPVDKFYNIETSHYWGDPNTFSKAKSSLLSLINKIQSTL